MIHSKTILLVLAAVLLAVPFAAADEVRLENGDRITGKVVQLENGILVLDTGYAGEVKIQWSAVVYLAADKPLPIIFQDGSSREGRRFVRTGAAPAAQTGAEPADVRIAEVKGINTPPKPPVKISARANAGISIEKGNTDTEQYNFNGEFIARTTSHRFSVGGELNNEKTDSTTSARNWRGYGKYDYFLSDKWFLYAGALYENDEFADLNLRSTYGAGVGHQFFESDHLNLSLSVGAAYVAEDFIEAGDNEFTAGQWLIRYDQYFFDKFVQLFHDNNGYVSFEDADNWLINTRQGLRLPLYEGFLLTVQYNYDYNHQPSPDATSKWDSKFLLLIGYRFEN
jgi:putative salt-induced outer membrane protein YdiY